MTTPWTVKVVHSEDDCDRFRIRDRNGQQVCVISDERKATRIVTAVNNFDEMAGLLERWLKCRDTLWTDSGFVGETEEDTKDLLTRIKENQNDR